eukprot:Platyproteum_vivax@DN2041_c0_g1_i1.p2
MLECDMNLECVIAGVGFRKYCRGEGRQWYEEPVLFHSCDRAWWTADPECAKLLRNKDVVVLDKDFAEYLKRLKPSAVLNKSTSYNRSIELDHKCKHNCYEEEPQLVKLSATFVTPADQKNADKLQ